MKSFDKKALYLLNFSLIAIINSTTIVPERESDFTLSKSEIPNQIYKQFIKLVHHFKHDNH